MAYSRTCSATTSSIRSRAWSGCLAVSSAPSVPASHRTTSHAPRHLTGAWPRRSNAAALRLYDKYGFQRVGVRSRYYSDDHEDAYALSVSDIGTASFERRFERLRNEHRERYGEYAREL